MEVSRIGTIKKHMCVCRTTVGNPPSARLLLLCPLLQSQPLPLVCAVPSLSGSLRCSNIC